MLAEGLLDSHFYNNATQKHSMVIAGVGDVPVEIDRGVRIDQHDLCSSHEEADIHITQHAIDLGLLGKSGYVVFDNKDVYVLLVHFYNSQFKASNPPPPRVSPRKMRKHHGNWRFGFSALRGGKDFFIYTF